MAQAQLPTSPSLTHSPALLAAALPGLSLDALAADPHLRKSRGGKAASASAKPGKAQPAGGRPGAEGKEKKQRRVVADADDSDDDDGVARAPNGVGDENDDDDGGDEDDDNDDVDDEKEEIAAKLEPADALSGTPPRSHSFYPSDGLWPRSSGGSVATVQPLARQDGRLKAETETGSTAATSRPAALADDVPAGAGRRRRRRQRARHSSDGAVSEESGQG